MGVFSIVIPLALLSLYFPRGAGLPFPRRPGQLPASTSRAPARRTRLEAEPEDRPGRRRPRPRNQFPAATNLDGMLDNIACRDQRSDDPLRGTRPTIGSSDPRSSSRWRRRPEGRGPRRYMKPIRRKLARRSFPRGLVIFFSAGGHVRSYPSTSVPAPRRFRHPAGRAPDKARNALWPPRPRAPKQMTSRWKIERPGGPDPRAADVPPCPTAEIPEF